MRIGYRLYVTDKTVSSLEVGRTEPSIEMIIKLSELFEFDNVENVSKIFKIIGLEKGVVVDKTIRTYFYLDKYEVALDCVDGLRHFIEIKVKKYDRSIILIFESKLE